MAQRDSAFLWETEALRSARPVARRDAHPKEEWATLREASEMTGIPVSTIRKWALRQAISSRLDPTPTGEIRMVSMDAVYARARSLGRDVTAPASRPVQQSPGPANRLDPTPMEPARSEPELPEGTMLVPLDAWTKVLNQLGNLHEAGQQLAEARERAARAETEAAFLRERLAELRAQLAGGEEVREPQEPNTPEQPPSSPWSAVSGVWAVLRRPKRPRS